MRRAHWTGLSDAEWSCIEPHLSAPKSLDTTHRLHAPHEIFDAIFYEVRSDCAWRLLPYNFPPWKTVHHYSRT